MMNLRRNKTGASGGKSPLPMLTKGNLFLLLMLVMVILAAIYYFAAGSNDVGPEAAEQALINTFGAESYCFTTYSTVYLDQAERIFCQLQGEKSGESRHIMGELLGTPINIYLVNQALYQQSSMDKSWRQVAEADLAQAQKLVGEIAPENNFNYADTGEVIYLGEEEIEGQKLHKMELHPVLSDVWIERYFTDIQCLLWLDKAGEYVVMAETTAISAENPNVHLRILNTFSNIGEPMEIIAPL